MVAMEFVTALRRLWTRRPAQVGLLCQRGPADRRSVVLCTLLQADAASQARVVARAARWPRVRVVALTDSHAAAPLFAAGLAVEHLPSPATVGAHAGLGPWRAYLEARLDMVRAKWTPALVVDEGISVAAYLDLCGAAQAASRQLPGRDHEDLAAA
jgi:hypothetical protein